MDDFGVLYGRFHMAGGTPKCLVYKGKSQSEMDDDWGYPHFRKLPYVIVYI